MPMEDDPRTAFKVDSVAKSCWSDPMLWLVLLAITLSSAVAVFLPVTFPVFKRVFGASLQALGSTQGLFYLSAVGFAFCGGWLLDRMGYRFALVSTLLLTAAALVLIGAAPNIKAILVGAFLSGLGVLSIVVVTSSIISDQFRARRQHLLFIHGLCGAIGSAAGPAILGWWLSNRTASGNSWRIGYYCTAILLVGIAISAIVFSTGSLSRGRSQQGTERSALRQVLRDPAIYLVCILSVLKSISEGGMIAFVGLFNQRKFALSTREAALFLSANSIGIFSGRSVLVWITSRWRLPDLTIFSACMAGATVAFWGTVVAPSYGFALLSFGLSGLFFSGSGPALTSYTGMRFAAHVLTAFGLLAGISYVGGAGGSYLIGYFGHRAGLETAMWTVPLSSLLVTAVGIAWMLCSEKPSPPTFHHIDGKVPVTGK